MRTQQLAAMVLCATLAGVPVLAAEKYGAGVSIEKATPITQLLSRPAEFAGKTVRVEGVVTEVCTMMGCWMALSPDGQANAAQVLIQVEHDGVIVFPVTAKGHKASAEGVVEKIEGGEGREAAQELASAQGTNAAQAPQWRIAATGAVVY